jgi:hypothetical protein
MIHDIHVACRVSGFTRPQIAQAQSRWGMVLASVRPERKGQAGGFVEGDLFRLAVLSRFHSLGFTWDVLREIDATAFGGWEGRTDLPFERSEPPYALVVFIPAGAEARDFEAAVIPLEPMKPPGPIERALRVRHAGISIVVNLTDLAAEVRRKLSEIEPIARGA